MFKIYVTNHPKPFQAFKNHNENNLTGKRPDSKITVRQPGEKKMTLQEVDFKGIPSEINSLEDSQKG